MKKKDVRRIVDENIDSLKALLGLDSWTIHVEYGKVKLPGRTDGNFWGKCVTDPAHFENATIVIDPKKHNAEQDVIETLIHELCHAVISCFNQIDHVIEEFVSPAEYKALSVMWYHANEQVVERICRIVTNLYGG